MRAMCCTSAVSVAIHSWSFRSSGARATEPQRRRAASLRSPLCRQQRLAPHDALAVAAHPLTALTNTENHSLRGS